VQVVVNLRAKKRLAARVTGEEKISEVLSQQTQLELNHLQVHQKEEHMKRKLRKIKEVPLKVLNKEERVQESVRKKSMLHTLEH